MLLDGQSLPTLPGYDLCIIGSGIAGQVIYEQLKDSSLRIAMLEAGGLEEGELARDQNLFYSDGLPLAPDSRERRLGGTAHTWQKICVAPDEVDFERRDWLEQSGWPVSFSDLESWFDAADSYLQLLKLEKRNAVVRGRPALELNPDYFQPTTVVFTDQLDGFEPDLLRHLEASDKDDLITAAPVVELFRSGGQHAVTSVGIGRSGGGVFTVESKAVVLAAGAIENVRLMLLSDRNSGGLGNEHDVVGRYFMEHPKGEAGEVLLSKPLQTIHPLEKFEQDGASYACGLRLTKKVQQQHGLLNSAIKFQPKRKAGLINRLVVKNFMEMAPVTSMA